MTPQYKGDKFKLVEKKDEFLKNWKVIILTKLHDEKNQIDSDKDLTVLSSSFMIYFSLTSKQWHEMI